MGRTGSRSSSRSGSRSSSSRRSSSRSSSSHRSSGSRSSSRTGSYSSRSRSFGSSSGSTFSGFGRSYGPKRSSLVVNNYGTGHGYGSYCNSDAHYSNRVRTGLLRFVLIMFAVTSLIIFLSFISINGTNITKSTVNREPITGVVWQNDCIIDELGWFEDIPGTERSLQHFYETTGIQPYIYLRGYDASLVTDEEKELFAEEWYGDNIDDEGTLLFVYFAEYVDDDGSGLMTLINGKSISPVMDSEAVRIFWNYIDSMWDDASVSTDDLFIRAFNKTADRIMTKSTTVTDVAKWGVIAVTVICVGLVVMSVMKLGRKHAAEEAAETKRILETPIDNLVQDELLDKYDNKGE